ncbi:MAG: macro domain-containing protein [Pirellula sp.]|jgi:O-acetyl-ADP-ribose deacetylase (regulator of RNase III)
MAAVELITGDLLNQDVEAIVNAWNRNIIPWWLLLPQGVSGAIKKRAGYQPFREVAKYGPIPLGGAVLTSAGRLPFKGIIHVAGISMWWRSSEYSIRESCRNAIRIAKEHSFASVAFPLIGAGTGGGSMEMVEKLMIDQIGNEEYSGRIVIVRYKK